MANDPDDRPWERSDRERRYDDDDADRPRSRRDDRSRYQEPHRGVAVLVLGIMGLLVCGICGIVAWVMGGTDLKKMDAGRMDPEGRGLTQAGRIMGLVSMIILALTAVMFVVWIVFVGVMLAVAPAPAPANNNQFNPPNAPVKMKARFPAPVPPPGE